MLTKPTARGLGVLAGAGALLGAGLLLAYREMIVLGAAGLVAFALGAAWGLPPPMVVDRVVEPRRVRRYEPASTTVDLIVAGRGRHVLRVSDVIREEGDSPRTTSVGEAETAARPGSPARVTFSLPTERRGTFHIGPIRLRRDDPLGLWAVVRPVGTPHPFTVWPRWHPLTRMAAGHSAEIEGERELVDAGSITFHALREYVPGDDLRHIHWRTSARAGTLMVRKHVDAAVARLAVVLDDRTESYVDPDGFEEAVEVAASLVVSTMDDGRRMALLTPREPERDRPVSSAAEGLDILASLRARPGPESAADIVARLRLRPPGDALIVITGAPAVHVDETGTGLLGSLPTLGPRYRTTTVAVIGKDEGSGFVVAAPTAAELVARLQDRAWNASLRR